MNTGLICRHFPLDRNVVHPCKHLMTNYNYIALLSYDSIEVSLFALVEYYYLAEWLAFCYLYTFFKLAVLGYKKISYLLLLCGLQKSV